MTDNAKTPVTDASKATPQASATESAEKKRLDSALAAAKSRREEMAKARTEAPRQRVGDLGGLRLKLAVESNLPGQHLYWANDEEGAIEQLLYEGFDFVEPEEVKMVSAFVVDKDLGNRVSRYVGKKADSSPMRAYLLKCSDEIWAQREEPRNAQADIWDKAIREGKIQPTDGRYRPKDTKLEVDTHYRKEY